MVSENQDHGQERFRSLWTLRPARWSHGFLLECWETHQENNRVEARRPPGQGAGLWNNHIYRHFCGLVTVSITHLWPDLTSMEGLATDYSITALRMRRAAMHAGLCKPGVYLHNLKYLPLAHLLASAVLLPTVPSLGLPQWCGAPQHCHSFLRNKLRQQRSVDWASGHRVCVWQDQISSGYVATESLVLKIILNSLQVIHLARPRDINWLLQMPKPQSLSPQSITQSTIEFLLLIARQRMKTKTHS